MSIILTDEDKNVILLCKGADSIIEPRLSKDTDEIVLEKTRNLLYK